MSILPPRTSTKPPCPRNSSTAPASLSPNVLLVEDHPFLLQITSKQLTSCGCTVETASTGEEALSHDFKSYDLIFLDIGLPDIDGITLCRMIRQEEKNKNWPPCTIIFLTAQSDKDEEALAAGANAYYEKPVMKETIKTIISEWQKEGREIVS